MRHGGGPACKHWGSRGAVLRQGKDGPRSLRMHRRCLFAALAAFAAGPLAAQQNRAPAPPAAAPARRAEPAPEGAPAALSAADRAELARLEAHLDGIRALTARFVQVDARGGSATGRLWLSRPGRMRFEYDPPSPVLLVADGRFVIFHDRSVMQTSHIPLASTPLSLLLADRIRLDEGEAQVTRLTRGEGLIQVTLIRRGRAHEGSLMLVFTEPPLALRQWLVTDAQRQTVRVTLLEVETGGRFDPALFRFVDPRFFDPSGGN